MAASVKHRWFINDSKQQITVSIDNRPEGVVAYVSVGHVKCDGMGYTMIEHAVFEDYAKREMIGERVKRVTKKVLEQWQNTAQELYEKHLPMIQKQYPNYSN